MGWLQTFETYDKDYRLVHFRYTSWSGGGSGEYRYDSRGRLTMRVDDDEQIRSLIFDKTGRIVYQDCRYKDDKEPGVNNLGELRLDSHGNYLPDNWEIEYYN